ncbi:hypothetical protein LMG31884_47150 (plasmid) [Xanthomonas hydrangeae]|uniref:hypothetical protein n=1 Tax=Xanthomonas hydrangeae TaxID=2775159 RepID=UPI001AF3B179|nr:hypothetical protein LMG31884_47150 [Xanthomonas hydrangeae]CAD7740999.1 hypothetical protein LMG31884_47150 [Xanthomonas hydrangeae]CAD7747990.1 hypothetical protein LMG31887_46660 [Xanthomonas hydrangeae]CAD7747991.1 hypothetical protein LMG31887_46660 [Xanthomonas hydrangeae]CAD7748132.1 hypothetical protein LMG31885_44830 [Xanthomonas hydrangeae]
MNAQHQEQQQKPAQNSSKAPARSKIQRRTPVRNDRFSGGMEIPAGHVVRLGQKLIAKPIRQIGERDTAVVQLAVRSFGFLLQPPYAVLTLAGFAACIELHCSSHKARAIADTLHRLSA